MVITLPRLAVLVLTSCLSALPMAQPNTGDIHARTESIARAQSAVVGVLSEAVNEAASIGMLGHCGEVPAW